MAKTQVLHIIDTLGIGGAEKIMTGTVNSLPEFQHHVIYLKGSLSLANSLPLGCRIKKLSYRDKIDIPRCVWELRRYIRKHNIDIVHSHLFMATLIARMACPKDVKMFTTIHSLPSRNYFAGSRVSKWLEKITYRRRHHLIAICREVFNDYNKCIGVKGPYHILYNYVDDAYYAADYQRTHFKDTVKLVAVGNLKPAKNYSYLIEAFKEMPENVSLDIYGSGPLEKELQCDIDKHGLNIKLCGVREDIYNVLPQYDAFIMSSIYEGQPISLLEAMASGIPSILSDIPVLREATNDQAIFYDLNSTHDLVSKVAAIKNHELDMDRFAKAGFDRVKKIANKGNYMRMLKKIYLQAGELSIPIENKLIHLFQPGYASPA